MGLLRADRTPDPGATAMDKAKIDYLTHKIQVLQLFLLLGYGIMFLLSVLLIIYMRYNRHVAFKGDAVAARKIILPAFEPLLWILGGATGMYTLYFCTALAADVYTTSISKLATEFFYSGRQFVFVIVIVFMLQKSVSIPALRRTVFISFLLSTYTIPIVWYMTNYGEATDFYWVLTTTRAALLLLYTYVFIRPPIRASKRTIREFCAYAFIYYGLLFAYNDMFHQNKTEMGFNLTYANLLCGSMCPLVIWRVLKADTEHWRGMGQRACALQNLFRQRHALDERTSSRGLHLLIEMHRKYIIDFAYLEIKQQIGVGSSAVVFNGVLHSRTPVAVKVYTPSEFSEDTVAEFSHEAALCGALHHPNIVRFYGMCVCPPTICLVSELCQGSLDDVMHAVCCCDVNPRRQQFLISLGYMLDAARAVAYLHSFSPPFVHRDIKPANFLVDADNNVKLTDFGESRSLPRSQTAPSLQPYMLVASAARLNEQGQYTASSSLTSSNHRHGGAMMTVRGTADYMAPEVINGRAGVASYGEAADVYSLAITMWDILNPGKDKYPSLRNNHLRVFEAVIDGKRPSLEASLHPSLREVIESAWHPNSQLRPSAENIVAILETVQEEVQALFATQLAEDLHAELGQSKHFTGAQMIGVMQDQHYVTNLSEGLRLGNALMDAGLLHHLRHARGFENSDSAYLFDEDNISLCHPIHPWRRSDANGQCDNGIHDKELVNGRTRPSRVHTSSSSSDYENSESAGGTEGSSSSRPLAVHPGLCACRKLGQRLGEAKGRRRRRNRRKAAFRAIIEEGVAMNTGDLTRNLLTEDDRRRDFTEFDHVSINIPSGA